MVDCRYSSVPGICIACVGSGITPSPCEVARGDRGARHLDGPYDGLAVPEADGLTEPLGYVRSEPRQETLLVELLTDVDLRNGRFCRISHVDDQLGRHDHIYAPAAVLRQASDETFGPAVRAGPLRGIAARVVIHLLHAALLILGLQQRQIRRDLQNRTVEPRSTLVALTRIKTVPVRQGRLRVDGGTALPARLGEQRFVMRLCSTETVGAHDLPARVIAIAVTPCRGRGRIFANQRDLVSAPDMLEPDRRVAAVIARIEPQRFLFVQIPRRENVGGSGSTPGGTAPSRAA
jgi:hypothetical protein